MTCPISRVDVKAAIARNESIDPNHAFLDDLFRKLNGQYQAITLPNTGWQWYLGMFGQERQGISLVGNFAFGYLKVPEQGPIGLQFTPKNVGKLIRAKRPWPQITSVFNIENPETRQYFQKVINTGGEITIYGIPQNQVETNTICEELHLRH